MFVRAWAVTFAFKAFAFVVSKGLKFLKSGTNSDVPILCEKCENVIISSHETAFFIFATNKLLYE